MFNKLSYAKLFFKIHQHLSILSIKHNIRPTNNFSVWSNGNKLSLARPNVYSTPQKQPSQNSNTQSYFCARAILVRPVISRYLTVDYLVKLTNVANVYRLIYLRFHSKSFTYLHNRFFIRALDAKDLKSHRVALCSNDSSFMFSPQKDFNLRLNNITSITDFKKHIKLCNVLIVIISQFYISSVV